MFIFENKKKGNSRIVKIFGYVVYIVSHSYKRRVQRFLGSLITTIREDKNNIDIKIIKFFDKVVSIREESADFKREYIGNVCIKNINKNKLFIQKYKKYIKNHTDIFVLNACSGETYLFLTYVFKPFLNKNDCKTPLLISTRKYHEDLIELICPNVHHIYLKNFPIFRKNKIVIENKNFYVMFTGDHFIQVENDIKNSPINTAHYFYSILEDLNISKEELSYEKVVVSEKIQQSMLKKIKKTKLNLNNFVFIAPEAASCEEYDNEFWVDLCNVLKSKGIDVFMNIIDTDTDIVGCDYKICKLSFAEAFALAKLSKGIISLRSGLTESLLQTNVPIFSLYTGFRNRYIFKDMSVEYVLSGFGLNKLPNINPDKLFEFNMSEVNNDKLISEIVEKI